MAYTSYAEKAKQSEFEIIENGDLVVRNAWMIYRNFAGAPDTFHPKGGYRNFSLLIDEPTAKTLIDMGWHIKQKPGREDGDEDYYLTEVTINPDSKFPPRLTLYTEFNGKKGTRELTVDDYAAIDKDIRIQKADLIVHLARTGGRYLQELRLVEKPQRSYLNDDEYADYYYDSDDTYEEVPFD